MEANGKASAPKLPPASLRAKITYGVLGALIALALFLVIRDADPHISFGTTGSNSATGTDRPAEFLYLDNNRVAAYLAQVEGGLAPSEHLTDKLTTEANAKVGRGDFAVGGTAQEERFVERTVTPTAASTFFKLENDLEQDDNQDARLFDLQAGDFSNLAGLEDQGLGEGSFVIIHGARLVSPRYISPYVVVRQA